jgi:hypothetical protein
MLPGIVGQRGRDGALLKACRGWKSVMGVRAHHDRRESCCERDAITPRSALTTTHRVSFFARPCRFRFHL